VCSGRDRSPILGCHRLAPCSGQIAGLVDVVPIHRGQRGVGAVTLESSGHPFLPAIRLQTLGERSRAEALDTHEQTWPVVATNRIEELACPQKVTGKLAFPGSKRGLLVHKPAV